ncbi:SLC13 family permease [Pseudogemmobacter sp. W21_MBD1_M6]|uniref:SLC13 family permease n=1 Tax=Pseudogemmobacter sp. W21_MBD1_M6 TaxID=3240271 RepID=UPI003F961B77
MTFQIATVLGLLVFAMGLYMTEWVSVDVVALALLAALMLFGILTPADAFAAFGSEIVIILAAIMVLAGAIVEAGVMDWLGNYANKVGGTHRNRVSMLLLLGISAASSALLSNTNTTAIMISPAVEMARRAKISASRILMPLAYASMLGGSCTLIGTSANLASSGLITRLGMEPFSLFEFLGIGTVITVIGLVWLVFPGQWLITPRSPVEEEGQSEPRRFFTTLRLAKGSSVIDTPIGGLNFKDFDADLLSVDRGGKRLDPHHSRKLREGDELIVRASRNGLLKLKKSKLFTLEPDEHFSIRYGEDMVPVMAEAVVMPQSRLVGKTLKQLQFFDQSSGIVLAIYRRTRSRPARIENMQLRAGDVLLLQGSQQGLRRMRGKTDLRVLMSVDETVITPRQGILTLSAMIIAVLVGALGIAPFSLSILIALLVVVLTGGVTMQEAYRLIEWRLLVVIAAMSGFGLAMETSGTAEYLAMYIVQTVAPFGSVFAMAAFCVLAVLLTQPMSNAGAALTVIPVAVAAAEGLDLNPRMLAVLVTLSASLSFISPLEPACLLVYDVGRYRFVDFVKAGTPLTIISVAILLVLVPLFWP